MIVLNGEPFVLYNLRALYPHAHQIIVVEGACESARNIAGPDGHSRDSTLSTLHRFQVEEDTEKKVVVVTAEDEGHSNGFWTEKDEMSQAYARRATGNYLWQVDSDEFYKEDDIEWIINTLQSRPEITQISVKQLTFWGGIDYSVDSLYLRAGAEVIPRIFKWGPGYSYVKHRPPTVHDENGQDLRDLVHISGHDLADKGIFMYHYSLLFPKQVIEKCDYYSKVDWTERTQAVNWAKDVFFELKKPFRVHNVYDYLSWLERFNGKHPFQIALMYNDIKVGLVDIELRQTVDIERLLASPFYIAKRLLLKKFWRQLLAWHRFSNTWSHRLNVLFSNPRAALSKVAEHLRKNRASD